jgi:hypothetical protein
MGQLDKKDLPRSFGIFTPTGHVVMGFATDADMRAARDQLLGAGIPKAAIAAFTSQEVVAEIKEMRSNSSLAASFMNESTMMEDHFKLASEGGGFLVVNAPSDAETARVVEIAKRSQLRIAHKYNRLTLDHIMK